MILWYKRRKFRGGLREMYYYLILFNNDQSLNSYEHNHKHLRFTIDKDLYTDMNVVIVPETE